jgi:CRP-like cAMP-binding protein
MTKTARDYKGFLRSGRWFSSLADSIQDALLDAATVRELKDGERLFSRGDPPTGLYAALDGVIRVSGMSPNGKEALLVLLEPPSWFGEISVFDRQPRTHDATAEGEARALRVPLEAIDALVAREPRFWRDLGLLVAAKLRLTFIGIEDLALLPLPVRLARRLALMGEWYGERHLLRRTVEVSQDQLAKMLATSRQTVNQLLKELEAKGFIKLAYASIEILELDELKKIAGGG